MSLKMMTRAFDAQNLSATDKFVLLALADNASEEGMCFPSISRIIHKTCLSRSAVKRSLRSLIEKKMIRSDIRYNDEGRQTSNTYTLILRGSSVTPLKSEGVQRDTLEGASVTPPRGSVWTPNHHKEPSEESNINITQSKSGSVEIIFDFYKVTLNHPGAKLSEKRKRLIKAALKLYSADDLKKAITGCSTSKWNMGDNDKQKPINSIELIFRDSGKIEQFMGYCDDTPKKGKNKYTCSRCGNSAKSLWGHKNICDHCHDKDVEISDAKYSRTSPITSVIQHLVK